MFRLIQHYHAFEAKNRPAFRALDVRDLTDDYDPPLLTFETTHRFYTFYETPLTPAIPF